MKSKVVGQVEEILKGVTSPEELIEIERVIAEARGAILRESSKGFWEGKRPCWEMSQCPEMIRSECPAPKYQSFPCWEIEGTYCKLDDYGASGLDTSICEVCRVYKRWGENKPIEIRQLGKGIDTSVRLVEELAKETRVQAK